MEDNKLIAEFMGMEMYTDSIMIRHDIHLGSKTSEGISIDNLQYHSSWDWLMPVIDSIYILGIDAQESKEIRDIMDGLVDVNFPHTYKAVVQFIKTHNDGR